MVFLGKALALLLRTKLRVVLQYYNRLGEGDNNTVEKRESKDINI